MTLLGAGQWFHTHNGVELNLELFHAGLVGEQWFHHDQIGKSSLLDLGGGAAFTLSPSMDIFVSVGRSVHGTNGHFHAAVASIGISRGFGTRFATDRATTENGPGPAPSTAFVCTCAKSR